MVLAAPISGARSSLPVDDELATTILWSITDLVEPAFQRARQPGITTAADLGAAILANAEHGVGPVRAAIIAVAALHPGYQPAVDRAHAGFDSWLESLSTLDATTALEPGRAKHWVDTQLNVGLRPVVALAGAVTPPMPETARRPGQGPLALRRMGGRDDHAAPTRIRPRCSVHRAVRPALERPAPT